jgi:hypothetical protein
VGRTDPEEQKTSHAVPGNGMDLPFQGVGIDAFDGAALRQVMHHHCPLRKLMEDSRLFIGLLILKQG